MPLGIGISLEMGQGGGAAAAAAPAGPPVILNGDFTDTSHWVIASGGGAASMSIAPGSPGTLNSVSGSGFGSATCTQTLSGVVAGQSYTISGTCTARVNGTIAFSLGGGVAGGGVVPSGPSALGPFTMDVVAGSLNQDLMLNPLSGLGGRSVSITNLVIA